MQAMIWNKWTWITAIVLVPFLALWLAFSLVWALGMLGAVAVLLLLGIRERTGYTKGYSQSKEESTVNSRFAKDHSDAYYIPDSPIYQPLDLEEDEEEDYDDIEVRHIYEVRHVHVEMLRDEDEEDRSSKPRRSGANGAKIRQQDRDVLRGVRQWQKEHTERINKRLRGMF